MRILHIANCYGGTDVYSNLISALDRVGDIQQTVYVPLNSRNHIRVGNKMIDFVNPDSRIIYSTVLKPYHRYFYTLKIKRALTDLLNTIDVNEMDLIHTGTAFMDGAIAYEIYLKYKVPYLVTIRNTDINIYYKILKFKHNHFFEVLTHSSKIIFASPAYKRDFLSNILPNSILRQIMSKCVDTKFGVDRFFLENITLPRTTLSRPIRLLFAGAFIKNKGLKQTVEAVCLLRHKRLNINLTAIGNGLPFRQNEKPYIQQIKKYGVKYDWLTLKDYQPFDGVIQEMSAADIFILNSHKETFGLCYAEALTQGLPIVYTRGQGFDGQFPDGFVGYAVDSHDISSIAEGIEKTIRNYDRIVENIRTIDMKGMFSWERVAAEYYALYKGILK